MRDKPFTKKLDIYKKANFKKFMESSTSIFGWKFVKKFE